MQNQMLLVYANLSLRYSKIKEIQLYKTECQQSVCSMQPFYMGS